MERPAGSEFLSTAEIRVLMALVTLYEREGRATVKGVTDLAGLRSTSTTHQHLTRMRRKGFVSWHQGAQGTLRPLLQRTEWTPSTTPSSAT